MTYAYNLPGTPTAVYSLRQAVSGYAGYCLRVQLANTGTTMDVGFSADGRVDFATALAWAGPETMLVIIWYDQSGNGYDLLPVTDRPVPQFSLLNGNPWVDLCDGTNLQPASIEAGLALTSGSYTYGIVLQNIGCNTGVVFGTDNWALFANYSQDYLTAYDGGTLLTASNHTNLRSTQTFAIINNAGAGTLYGNGNNVGSGTTGTHATPAALLTLGSYYNQATAFIGVVSEIYIYGSAALTGAQVQAIQANELVCFPLSAFDISYNGLAQIQLGGTTIACGDVLKFEYTQPWTFYAAINLFANVPYPYDTGIISNINHTDDSTFTGYGMMMSSQNRSGQNFFGVIHLLVDSHYPDVHAIEAFGSINISDGNKHFVVATYDGSGTAAGFKAYIDGVPDTLTITEDNLAGNSILDPSTLLNIGSQANDAYAAGTIAFAQIDSIARDATYIATYSTPNNLPPNDSTYTQLRMMMTEGSGATVHDTGAVGNGLDGTLNNAAAWRAPSWVGSNVVVTEARDVAAFAVFDKNVAALAVTEARDVAAIAIYDRLGVALAVTEARDVASFSLLWDYAALAVTESRDVPALGMIAPVHTTLATTETRDAAAFTVTHSVVVTVAVTEASDVAAFAYTENFVGQILATEARDAAAFELFTAKIVVTSADAPGSSGQLYYAIGQDAVLSVSYKDPDGAPVVPEVLRLLVQPPTGDMVVHSRFKSPYPGVYVYDLPLTAVGLWTFIWETSGTFLTFHAGEVYANSPTFS